MLVYKCDLCKKAIKGNSNRISISYNKHGLGASTLCESCGKPIVNFMKKKKLIKNE